jgi:hypothetical protein
LRFGGAFMEVELQEISVIRLLPYYMYLHIVRAYFEKPPFFTPKQTPMALGQWLIGLRASLLECST